MDSHKHIAIIGAGLAGLSAAYDLVKGGNRVTIIESAPDLGGLASSTRINGAPVERFYHFICRADHDLIQLVDELGLVDRLHWRQNRTAFYYSGKIYSFGTPLDLIRFSAVPVEQRMRFGVHILRSRMRSQWRWLDQIPAKPWLIENIGEQAYRVIWEPLLQIKFGQYHEQISAAWVWHRIWRVAQSRQRIWEQETFGYLDNGSFTLVNQLASRLAGEPQIRIMPNTRAQSVEIQGGKIAALITDRGRITCDAFISTIALPYLNSLVSQNGRSPLPELKKIRYIGVVCALFNLSQPFSRNFWMNINDPHISFNGIIEQTNLNANLKAASLNLIYIPFYIPTDQPRYHYPDEQLFVEYVGMLKRINPTFSEHWVRDYAVFRTPHAQAICTTGFREIVPEIRTSIPGIYLTDSAQFYPEDRTLSAAIQKGRQAANLVLDDLNHVDRITL